MSMEITTKTVKVGCVPGRIVEVELSSTDNTIAELFELAGVEVSDGALVRVNGEERKLTDQIGDVFDGTGVYASATIKGN